MLSLGFISGLIPVAAVGLKLFLVLTTGRCSSRVCLNGKTALVTGGNSGIGLETVLALASRGCRVIIADKDDATETTKRVIERTHNEKIVGRPLDLSSFSSVRTFSEDILKSEDELSILINNAGVGVRPNIHTGDGVESLMQVNFLGHFLLTHLLADLLKKSAPSRVVFTSSMAAFVPSYISAENLNTPEEMKYGLMGSCWKYVDCKKCCDVASTGFAERLREFGVTSNSLNPGIVATPFYTQIGRAFKFGNVYDLLKYLLFLYAKTPEEGAQTTIDLAVSNRWRDVTGGHFWDCRQFWDPPITRNRKLCEDIWRRSEEMCGLGNEEKLSVERRRVLTP